METIQTNETKIIKELRRFRLSQLFEKWAFSTYKGVNLQGCRFLPRK
jgi:hypothetical protein